jgi:hypothetical protein
MKKDIDISEVKTELPAPVELSLIKWMMGVSVKHTLPPSTFFRHRQIILAKLGLDISLAYQKKQAKRVCFDIEYLKEREVKTVPDIFQGWLFKPEDAPTWEAN